MTDPLTVDITLFDDESVRKKLTVMDAIEAAVDDARNPDMNVFWEVIASRMEMGKTYRITFEEAKGPAVDDDLYGDFEIEIWYFKASGKFGYEAKHTGRFRYVSHTLGSRTVLMQYVVDWMVEMCRTRLAPLPGLSCKSWDGHIVVNCAEGYPCLITVDRLAAAAVLDEVGDMV